MTAGRTGMAFAVAALVVGMGVPSAAPARPEPTGSPVAKQASTKQRGAVKCRKNQTPIKVRRRTVGCRSLRAALPPPREGDTRLLLAKSVLDDDLRALRDRRGRRAPSLKKLFRKIGPRAYRTVQRTIPKGLARLDQLAGAPAVAARFAAPAGQAANCAESGAPVPTRTDTFTSSSGGQKMTAIVSLGRVGTFDLLLEGGAYSIKVGITTDECSGFDAPACPTAAGVVDATDRSSFKVSLTVAHRDTVLMSRSFDFSGRTKMHADVGKDAKLVLIDIDDTQTANIELGGAKQEFGPVNLIYTGIHQTRVQMPSGSYEPGHGAVDISLTARGVTVGRSDLGQVGNNIAKDLDESFAALVKREIGNFRHLEADWNRPDACVKVTFDPASRALKLGRGQHGSVSAQAIAEQGGGAAEGIWRLSGPQNASFTPDEVEGAAPAFSYDVTNAGKDILVSVSVRVTSKAGVGDATWEQETEDAPLYRGTVSGTRSFHSSEGCSLTWQWSYDARLADMGGSDQPFPILDTNTGAGIETGGAGAYDETGSGMYALAACNGLPGCSTNLERDPVYGNGLVLFGAEGDTVGVTVDATDFTGACERNWGRRLGEGSFPRSMIGAETITVDLSYHDDVWDISGTLTLTRVN